MAIEVIAILVSVWLLADAEKKINFTYIEGSRPWLNHIPSEINTTFEAALQEHRYLRRLVCVGDSTGDSDNPISPFEPICLKGRGAKMVVPPRLYPRDSTLIFTSPSHGGLIEKKYETEKPALHYYAGPTSGRTKYFLIPFNGCEVPTFYPIESSQHLSIWKEVFQAFNNMSDEYFNSHIRVVSTYVTTRKVCDEQIRHFRVHYYFYVDWAQVKLTDGYRISCGQIQDNTSPDSLLNDANYRGPYIRGARHPRFTRVKTVNSIADRLQIVGALEEVSPVLRSDVNKDLGLNSAGQLVLKAYGTVNERENKCIRAHVTLEDAVVYEIEQVACRITCFK